MTSFESLTHVSLRSSLVALFTVLVGCGGDHPGGSVGDVCADIGSSEECADGEVCDSVSGFGDDAYCLRSCEEQSDCEDGENCNGISGESGKACHPVSDGETEDEPADDDESVEAPKK